MDDETAADTEVLIAGAGPVGLALALQRFGIRFRIVEKNAERSTTSKALGLQPRLSEVFAILSDPAHAVRATALVREAIAASDELSPPKSLGAYRCTVLAGSRSCR